MNGAVLGRTSLVKLLGKAPTDPDALVVTPLLKASDLLKGPISEDAIDVRLGTDFLAARSDRVVANVPGNPSGSRFYKRMHVPIGGFLVLPGHHTVLASTLEYIKLPSALAAMVLTKSSWARNFVTIETAPWVHPNYRGCLTLEVANVSEVPQILYPGYRIAQLVFFHLDQKETEAKGGERNYHGPIRPEPPIIPGPRVHLGELGVDPRDVRDPTELMRPRERTATEGRAVYRVMIECQEHEATNASGLLLEEVSKSALVLQSVHRGRKQGVQSRPHFTIDAELMGNASDRRLIEALADAVARDARILSVAWTADDPSSRRSVM